ncbi:MAG TPA: YceI family protein [Acidimicrobiales bacterium]|nr:YceI family protein [Acidimicrobiales bacterium]
MRTQRRGPGRRWARWIIGGVAVLVVLLVGGPFVYIHFIEGKAPAPLSLSTATTAAGTGAPTSTAAPGPSSSAPSSSAPSSSGLAAAGATGAGSTVDGTWKVAAGSVAGYRIKETLFGQSNTAVGRTSSVTGSITISGAEVRTGTFSVDMTTVKSDESQRDHQFQGRIMDTSQFPTATFALTKPITLGSVPADGVVVTEPATGNLTLHGTTRPVTFTVQAKRSGSTIGVSGSVPIVFADYGIDNPSGGPAQTSDNGTLEFLLNFTQG